MNQNVMNPSELSQAFAHTIAQGQAPASVLRTLMHAWPPGSWRADLGDPSPLEAVACWKPQKNVLLPEQQRAWADLAAELLDHHASHGYPQLLGGLVSVLQTGVNETMARVFMERAARHLPNIPDSARAVMLRQALSLNWSTLADDLMRLRAAPAMGSLTPDKNPFAWVRTQVSFDALLAAGYDPYVPTATGEDSTSLLRQRTVRDEKQPNGFQSATDRAAVMRRLTEMAPSQNPANRLDRVIRQGQRWTELQAELRALGDEAWTVRFDGGGTLLHHLTLHKPQWTLNLLRWPGLKHAPDALFSALDDAGMPGWLYRWLAPDPRNKNGSVKQSPDAWWDELCQQPAAQRWIDARPILPPDEPLKRLLRAAIRTQSTLPSLGSRSGLHAEPALWRQLKLLGSYGSQEAREDLPRNAETQALFDQAVWDSSAPVVDQRRGYRLTALMNWYGDVQTLASPWLANQFAMNVLDRYMHQASPASDNDQKFCQALQMAFDAGASLTWIEDKIARGLTPFQANRANDPRQLWQQMRTAQERRLLGATFESPNPAAVPGDRARPRL